MKISMRFVCVGTIVPKQYEVTIEALSNASNRFLWNLTDALDRHGQELHRLSYMGIPVEADVKHELQQAGDDEIKYVWKSKGILKGIRDYHKLIKRELKKADCLLVYNVVYSWLFAPLIAHRMHKKAILILADYSEAESYSDLTRKLYASIQKWSMRRYDRIIGLSQNTEKFLRKGQEFCLMEGGINQDFYDEFATPDIGDEELIHFMYAGILEKVTGIDLLLQAFTEIEDKRIRLYISGKGSLESLVRSAQEKDARIQYLGCPPYEEYMQNLHKADILLNPRNMNLPENKNNFPSKIMEYLATGKPILSTRFPGWERFDGYVRFCGSECKEISNGIQNMISKYIQESHSIFLENRSFAQKYIWDNQVNSVFELEM